jgi:Mn2+/Fe2+ NRAMP family transporter
MKTILKSMGPGLVWAAAAIGVSHLVQSTRAGANYGFELIWFILIINIIKYPFFQFGPRYASATGESLMHGYQRLGSWAVWLFIGLTLLTMFGILSAVTMVTAGLFAGIIGPGISVEIWALILLVISALISYLGRFKLLDNIVKVIIVALSVTTVVAVVSAAMQGFHPKVPTLPHMKWQIADVAFLIALAGWMPSAIDISVWHSFWTLAKRNRQGKIPTVKESLFDFNIGYVTTIVISIGFLLLGALVMYGSGETLSANGEVFSKQLIAMYTSSIGSWAYYIIAVAALSTMFSTTLTVIDGFPRVLSHLYLFVASRDHYQRNPRRERSFKLLWLVFLIAGTFGIIRYLVASMNWLVDVATTISFLTAPLLGYLNLRAMTANHVPLEARPGKALVIFSKAGIIFMAAFGVVFLVWRFFG